MMGFDASQIDAMSIWQFNAQMLGWGRQFDSGDTAMTETERDELWDLIQKKGAPLSHRRAN